MRVFEPFARHRRLILRVALVVLAVVLLVMVARSVPSLQRIFDSPPSTPGAQHWLLRWLDTYGLPLAFVAMIVGATGLPLPGNLLVLTMGAAAAEGRHSAAWVFLVILAGLVVGDLLGYLVGSWGGRWLVRRIAHFLGSDEQVPRARDAVQQRGWMAVFLTRWLLSPLGSPCNWVCGSMGYPIRRFVIAGLLGEIVYVAIYLLLGMAFSEQIEQVAQVVETAGLSLLGLLLVGFLLWKVFRTPNTPVSV